VTAGFQIPGDLAISADGRHFLLWQGAEEIANRINVGIQTFYGTWIYDRSKGVKYMQGIFEKPQSAGLALLRAEVWRVVAETAGVGGVDKVTLAFDPIERQATVAWQAHTEGGEPLASEVIIQ
jgi:hypothetical protein